jgi:cation diffusion facilitator family transporter
MANCCNDKSCDLERLRERQSATLKGVLTINAGMFAVELFSGLAAGSVALIADSLDMLGDALVYGFSLYVVTKSARMKAVAALMKGSIMLLFGIFVLLQSVLQMIDRQVPAFETIGLIGLLALLANAGCLLLLSRHRNEDINMRSIWICSRNDILANVAVLVAALAVWVTASGWPDILIGLGLAALFLRSAWNVLQESISELRATPSAAV